MRWHTDQLNTSELSLPYETYLPVNLWYCFSFTVTSSDIFRSSFCSVILNVSTLILILQPDACKMVGILQASCMQRYKGEGGRSKHSCIIYTVQCIGLQKAPACIIVLVICPVGQQLFKISHKTAIQQGIKQINNKPNNYLMVSKVRNSTDAQLRRYSSELLIVNCTGGFKVTFSFRHIMYFDHTLCRPFLSLPQPFALVIF